MLEKQVPAQNPLEPRDRVYDFSQIDTTEIRPTRPGFHVRRVHLFLELLNLFFGPQYSHPTYAVSFANRLLFSRLQNDRSESRQDGEVTYPPRDSGDIHLLSLLGALQPAA